MRSLQQVKERFGVVFILSVLGLFVLAGAVLAYFIWPPLILIVLALAVILYLATDGFPK